MSNLKRLTCAVEKHFTLNVGIQKVSTAEKEKAL